MAILSLGLGRLYTTLLTATSTVFAAVFNMFILYSSLVIVIVVFWYFQKATHRADWVQPLLDWAEENLAPGAQVD